MKQFNVRWTELEPVHYEANVYAENETKAAQAVQTDPEWASSKSSEKTITVVTLVTVEDTSTFIGVNE